MPSEASQKNADAEERAPTENTRDDMKKRLNWLLSGLAAAAMGCGPEEDPGTTTPTTGPPTGDPNPTTDGGTDSGATDASSGAGSEGTTPPPPPSTTTTPPPTTTTTTDGTSSGGSSGGGSSSGVVFVQEPDGGGGTVECDIWAQDCPAGEKCMPWANDGGNSWNATKCTAVDANPNQVGDPCTVEGSGVSGIDSCDEAMMCWDTDPDTGMGICIEFCTGSEASPQCSDSATDCVIANDGVLILCLPGCDPLLQDCADDDLCVPNPGADGFICVLDASGTAGLAGDPCGCANCCDAGLFCTESPQWVAGCTGTDGCCAPFCDLDDPGASATCPGASGGEECIAWYPAGSAPPGQDNIGQCVIPL